MAYIKDANPYYSVYIYSKEQPTQQAGSLVDIHVLRGHATVRWRGWLHRSLGYRLLSGSQLYIH